MNDLFGKKDLIYTVFQERSISKAAQKLFIAQPSLSVIIKKLEDDIGTPLFDRSRKPLGMTQAGMEYIRATEAIRHAERTFINYVDALNTLQTGTLALGSNQLFSSLVLPAYISQFLSKCPGIQLQLVDDNSTELKNQITSGQLDLVIDNQVLDEEMFEQELLTTEQLLLAVPSAFPCNRGLEHCRMQRDDILSGRHTLPGMPSPP